MSSKTPSPTAEIEALLAQRLMPACLDQFPIGNVEKVAEWSGPVSPNIQALILVGLHAVNKSPAFSDACADAISNSSEWRTHITTILGASTIGSHMLATVAKVLRRNMPTHPLSRYESGSARIAPIYDAIDDGERLRVNRAGWSDLGEGACRLIGLADPLGQVADAMSVFDLDWVTIQPLNADWLQRSRLACPAFLAITG